MNKFALGTLAAVVAFAGTLSAEEEVPQQTARDLIPDETRWEAFNRGEAIILVGVEGKPKDKGRLDPNQFPTGAILIDAPVQEVWDMVNDKEAAPSYVKSLLRCRIVGRGEAYMMVEQEMKMNGLPGTFTYIVKHAMKPMQRVDFERVSGDLRDIRGSWQFIPVEEGTKTMLIYSLHVDPGRLVPQTFVRRSMLKNLPKALYSIKTQVEQSE